MVIENGRCGLFVRGCGVWDGEGVYAYRHIYTHTFTYIHIVYPLTHRGHRPPPSWSPLSRRPVLEGLEDALLQAQHTYTFIHTHTHTHTHSYTPLLTQGIGRRRLGLLVHAGPVLEGLQDALLQARDGCGEVALRPELADAEEGEVAGGCRCVN